MSYDAVADFCISFTTVPPACIAENHVLAVLFRSSSLTCAHVRGFGSQYDCLATSTIVPDHTVKRSRVQHAFLCINRRLTSSLPLLGRHLVSPTTTPSFLIKSYVRSPSLASSRADVVELTWLLRTPIKVPMRMVSPYGGNHILNITVSAQVSASCFRV
jgi:hypothetical protein